MKRVILISLAFVLLTCTVVFLGSCMDRVPAPVCPVPTEVAVDENLVTGFDGVDMIVVIDNSGSMTEEQAILGTSFITLINSLVKPTAEWPYPPVANMRVGIVSSNLGLQYGEEGSTAGFPYSDVPVQTCTDEGIDPKGDDGKFQNEYKSTTVEIASGLINCDEGLGDNETQCPPDFECNNGKCEADENPYTVNCPDEADEAWFETAEANNPELALQIACMAALGKDGCGIEQQLQAAVRGIERYQEDFMLDNHLLAVLIVSDEEDCSIKDRGLFETPEWLSGTGYDESDPNSGLLNVACNYPEDNENDFLFSEQRFWTKYTDLKGNPNAVIFAAIVGVPTGEDSPCQGRGNELSECLDAEEMQISVEVYTDSSDNEYKHFANACTRGEEGAYVTEARPGKRYVQVAESFGQRGYVYSICNADWGPAMEDIAKVIAENLSPQCYAKHLEWKISEEQPGEYCSEDQCGMAQCDVVAIFSYAVDDENEGCKDLEVEGEITEENHKNESGQVDYINVYCPLKKLPAPIDCDSAKAMWAADAETAGWYYCQNDGAENFEEACNDQIDNDGQGGMDCADEKCSSCTEACPDVEPNPAFPCESTCMNEVKLTKKAMSLSRGSVVAVQCLQQFTFEDKNCQENTPETCNDGKDNDGNRIWDCEANDNHFADPHCCPMIVVVEDGEKKCKVDEGAFNDNCGGMEITDPKGACVAGASANGCTL